MKRLFSVLGFFFLLFFVSCTSQTVAISFEENGGTPVNDITEVTIASITLPQPTKEGYTFGGWFEDVELTEAFVLSADRESWEFTLYAKWIPAVLTLEIKHYTENLTADGYDLFSTTENAIDYSPNLDISSHALAIGGFTRNATVEIDDDTAGIIKVNLYYDRQIYTVSIDEAGGDAVDDIQVKYGYPLIAPEMSRHGFAFSGFTPVLPATMPIGGLSTTATWTALTPATVSYDENGGTTVPDEFTFVTEQATMPTPPTRTGYAFDNWYPSLESTIPYVFTTPLTANITLYAKWTPINVNYSVAYYYESLTGDYVLTNTVILQALTNSVVTHTAAPETGFFENTTHASRIVSGTVLADGTLLLKVYCDRGDYTIAFDSNAELSITAITLPYGSAVATPSSPIRTNFTFQGWYADETLITPYVFNTMPAMNITLYAKWLGVDTTLNFDSHGGSLVTSITAPLEGIIQKPADPTKTGYVFDGWYLDSGYLTEFTVWTMPSGGITLHAKWIYATYTVLFDENGGSNVIDITAEYLSAITKPANPTKTDYIFGGWYSDIALTTEFIFTTMPLGGITLYAKWVTELEASKLSNIIRLDEGTFATASGTVYYEMLNGFEGFYIFDDTGCLFILSDQTDVATGDLISISGVLHFWNGVPVLMHTSLLSVTSSSNPIPEVSELAFSTALAMTPALDIYASRFKTSGILVLVEGHYALYDLTSKQTLRIDDRFASDSVLDPLLGESVAMSLFYYSYNQSWNFGFTSIENQSVTDFDKTLLYANWIRSILENEIHYSGELFEFIDEDPFGWGPATYDLSTYTDEYIDSTTLRFKTVVSPVYIQIPCHVMINSTSRDFVVNLTLKPYLVSTIEQFIQSLPDRIHHLDVLVVMALPNDNLYIVKDASGQLVIRTDEYFEIGEQIVLKLNRNSTSGKVEVFEDDLIDFTRVLSQVELNNPAQPLSPLEIAALNLNDPTIYGRYIEVRGFLDYEYYGELFYHGFYQLSDDATYSLKVEPATYTAFETLFDWIGLEVIMRGYLINDPIEGLTLYFIGVREDIKLPEYGDQELIDMIVTLFARNYAGKTFQTFEEFMLYPYHPQLGGNIVWEFTGGSGDYYDFARNRFKFVDSDTQITLNMTISKNAVSETYTFTTTLKPLDYTTALELQDYDQRENVYIKGLVIYRSPNVAFIQDATGIIKYEGFLLDCFKGDYVVLYGTMLFQEYNDALGGAYLYDYWIEEEDRVVAILSRDNPVTILTAEYDLYAIDAIDPYDHDNYHEYVQVSGLLRESLDYPGYYELVEGSHFILIDCSDDYTYYKLEKLLLDHPENLYVTLNGYLQEYDFEDGFWWLFYTGMEEETGFPNYTDQEKADMVKRFILDTYAVDTLGNQTEYILPAIYGSLQAAMTYTAAGSNAYLINLVNHTIASVLEPTAIGINAIVTVGLVEESFYFEINVLPNAIPNNALPLTTIEAFKSAHSANPLRIEGRILSISQTSDGYAFLIEDTTGKILVLVNNSNWYYDYSMVGKVLSAVGVYDDTHARIDMVASTYVVGGTLIDIVEPFVQTDIADIVDYDLYDQTLIGQPLRITGTIVMPNYGEYYIVDGDLAIRISPTYPAYYTLQGYQGFTVSMTGYYIGLSLENGPDCHAIAFTTYDYGNPNNIEVTGMTDQEIVDQLLKQVVEYPYNDRYMPYDNIGFPSYHNLFTGVSYIYTVDSGSEYVSLSTTDLTFLFPSTDQIIEIDVRIEYGTDFAESTLAFYLEGFVQSTLEELFEMVPGTLEIALEAVVIHYGWGFTYFLIEGQIYYLQAYLDAWLEDGMEVVITGKKTLIDGIADYSYDIQTISMNESVYELVSRIITVEEIYLADFAIDPVYQEYLGVKGILRYDRFMEMFYLEAGIYKIYIREDLEEEMEAYSMYYVTKLTRSEMRQFIGDEIILYSLLSNTYVINEYLLVDFRGYPDEIALPDLTVQEHLDWTLSKILDKTAGLTAHTGDQLLYYILPTYDPIHETYISYEILNSAHQGLIDFDHDGQVNIVDVETQVTVTVTATYDIDTDTATFTITLLPLPLSTVREVLWGAAFMPYVIEGVVEYSFIGDDYWLILHDATGRIYVDCGGYIALGLTFADGDLIRILGEREHYEDHDDMPIFGSIKDINVISSGHVITNTPVSMTVEDILNLDYLNPDNFSLYVTMTGTVIFSGNFDYPSYDLREDGYVNAVYDVQFYGSTYDDFNTMMGSLVGDKITLEGYLIGFYYIYAPFDWIILHTSHEVLPE